MLALFILGVILYFVGGAMERAERRQQEEDWAAWRRKWGEIDPKTGKKQL